MTKLFKRPFSAPLGNQDGMVIIIGLMLLVVLTLMSTAAIDMGIVEQSISRNSEISQNNFYATESICVEGTAEIENISDDDLYNKNFPSWLVEDLDHIDDPAGVVNTPLEFADNTNWDGGNPVVLARDTSLGAIQPAGFGGTDRMKYVAVDAKIIGSLSDTSKKTHVYSVYSMYDVTGVGKAYPGRMLINVGYVRVVYAP